MAVRSNAVLFAPHNDDETLFAFYTLLRTGADVIVVLKSFRQLTQQNGPHWSVREMETAAVCDLVDVEYTQWDHYDVTPPWPAISEHIAEAVKHYETIIGPAWELGGHEDHNGVASILNGLCPERVSYLTYRRGYGRSTEGTEVVPTPDEAALKEQALALYPSQAAHRPTAEWFSNPDQREFRL